MCVILLSTPYKKMPANILQKVGFLSKLRTRFPVTTQLYHIFIYKRHCLDERN